VAGRAGKAVEKAVEKGVEKGVEMEAVSRPLDIERVQGGGMLR
jgi:hypothetical protein